MEDCVFCKIIKGDIKVNFIYEDPECVVFNSNEPVAEHHLLVIPKKHISNFLELDETILPLTKVAQKIINDRKINDGYKLIINGGKYQSVPHLHLHVLAGKLEDSDDILNRT